MRTRVTRSVGLSSSGQRGGARCTEMAKAAAADCWDGKDGAAAAETPGRHGARRGGARGCGMRALRFQPIRSAARASASFTMPHHSTQRLKNLTPQ